MSKKKTCEAPSLSTVFAQMGSVLSKTANGMSKKKSAVSQLAAMHKHLKEAPAVLAETDPNAHSEFTEQLAYHGCVAAKMLDAIQSTKGDIPATPLHWIDALVDATDGIANTLLNASNSFGSACGLAQNDEQAKELKGQIDPFKQKIADYSRDLFAITFGLRWYAGLPSESAKGLNANQRPCACCGSKHENDGDSNTMPPCPEVNLDEAKGEQQESLASYAEELAQQLEKLQEIILALAIILTWMASQPYMATNAGGPPCRDECTKTNNVIGTDVTNVVALAIPGSATAFQPQCDVVWRFCCTNWCLLFYWENFVITVTTGPHNLGGQVRLVNGQRASVAQTVADRRAAKFVPIRTLTPPAKPSC